MRIIKSALIQSGDQFQLKPGQPLFKSLITELYSNSDEIFSNAKELYQLRFADSWLHYQLFGRYY
jgi:hypothetical protein